MNALCAIFLVLGAILGYVIKWTQEHYKYPIFCNSRADEEYPEYDLKPQHTLHAKGRIFNPNTFPITIGSFSANTSDAEKLDVECKKEGEGTSAKPVTIKGRDMYECEFFARSKKDHFPEYLDIFYVDQTKKRRYALRYFSPTSLAA